MGVEFFFIYNVASEAGGRIGIITPVGVGGDLATVAAWRASCVVSMTDTDEMTRKWGAGLPKALAEHGIAWCSFPIRDYGAPQDADRRWPPLAKELHGVLDEGHGGNALAV